MPEQGRFEQLRGQGTAVGGDEHLLSPLRVGVNGLGDQLLARARLAGNQNGRAAGGHLRHQVQNARHAVAAAHDVREAVALLEGPLELGILGLQAPLRNDLGDLDQQLFVLPRLLNEVVGAAFERFDGNVDRAVGRHHEHRDLAVPLPDVAQHVHPRAVRHHQVEQDQVVVPGFELAQALEAVRGQLHRVPFQGEKSLQAFPDVLLVVHYQDSAFEDDVGAPIRHALRHAPLSARPGTPGGIACLRRAGFRLRSRRRAPARCRKSPKAPGRSPCGRPWW